MALGPAHTGYLFQDFMTAYIGVSSLLNDLRYLRVDSKRFPGDVFDDLEVADGDRRVRYQFKHSSTEKRSLEHTDLLSASSEIGLRRILQTALSEASSLPDEYRLALTWACPSEQVAEDLLAPSDREGTMGDDESSLYSVAAHKLWPAKGSSKVATLLEGLHVEREFFVDVLKRVVIECELPRLPKESVSQGELSQLFSNPGPLEAGLIDLLRERVGIGRYPNADRSPQDVAASSVLIAYKARCDHRTLGKSDFEAGLRLRTDFGRVAQVFPVDTSTLVSRRDTETLLAGLASERQHVLLLGAPGSGKSWLLTNLADALRKMGYLVARHYCFIDPADPVQVERTTREVLLANLGSELLDEDPRLRRCLDGYYIGNADRLGDLIEKVATITGRPIVLIVDGLDHITRVARRAASSPESPLDVVSELAALRLPAGASLILGSQPGSHLAHIRKALKPAEVELPAWNRAELAHLLHLMGVSIVLFPYTASERSRLFERFREVAEGNPLYATYLARELRHRVRPLSYRNLIGWLREKPRLDGNIANYYRYLYKTARGTELSIVEVLALIDFSISEADLRELLPGPLRRHVTAALLHLTPLLTNAVGQGGVRIWHESLRRFIVERLEGLGGKVDETVEPVAAWLERRGFYSDPRAYRFLLPALSRAGRSTDALTLVSTSFLTESIAAGYSGAAVRRNLLFALEVASESQDWAALVRVAELLRAAYTSFEYHLEDRSEFLSAFIDLFGAGPVSDRLLFDGVPCESQGVGLVVCSLVDDRGFVPPWSEYLEAAARPSKRLNVSTVDNQEDRLVSTARFHGVARLMGTKHACDVLRRSLREGLDAVDAELVRECGRRLVRLGSEDELRQLCENLNEGGGRRLSGSVIALKLCLAEWLSREGRRGEAEKIAREVLSSVETFDDLLLCVRLGASAEEVVIRLQDHAFRPSEVGSILDAERAQALAMWVLLVDLLGEVGDSDELQRQRSMITGEGWYPCWLRYVVDLGFSKCPTESVAGARSGILAAFRSLTDDVRPFAGIPRACDLLHIEGLIERTVVRGLGELRTPDEWRCALACVRQVIRGTSTTLQRSPGGPIRPTRLLRCLLPLAKSGPEGEPLVDFVRDTVEWLNSVGTYYDVHAHVYLTFARILARSGLQNEADDAWRRASQCFGGYGMRKDTTVYETLEGARNLVKVGRQTATEALVSVQESVEGLLKHTDGSGTKSAPTAWLRALLRVSPEFGAALVANSALTHPGVPPWGIDAAYVAVLEEADSVFDPKLLLDLAETIPVPTAPSDGVESTLEPLLRIAGRVARTDKGRVARYLARLSAQVVQRSGHRDSDTVDRIEQFRRSHGVSESGVSEPCIDHQSPPHQFAHSSAPSAMEGVQQVVRQGVSGFDDPALVLSSVRRVVRSTRVLEQQDWTSLTNPVGYWLLEQLQQNRPREVEEFLRELAYECSSLSSARPHPVHELAEGLVRAGYTSVGALALVLAHVQCAGGHGWNTMGDEASRGRLESALALEPRETPRRLAVEVARGLRQSSFNRGVSSELVAVAMLIGNSDVGFACWLEAASTLQQRTPFVSARYSWFVPAKDVDVAECIDDEWIVALLLVRLQHPVLSIKMSAARAVGSLLQARPIILIRPLRWFLSRGTTTFSATLVLKLLLEMEQPAFPVSTGLQSLLVLYSRSELWSLRRLALELLERAGIGTLVLPLIDRDSVPVSNVPRLAWEDIEQLDKGGRVTLVSQREFPALRERVEGRFNSLFYVGEEAHRDRSTDTSELAYGPGGKERPAVPVMEWPEELFETAYQLGLSDVERECVASGECETGLPDWVRRASVPVLRARVGLEACVGARFEYPLPSECVAGWAEVVRRPKGKSPYAGWVRLGLVERQWLRNSEYEEPTKFVLCSAFVASEALLKVPEVQVACVSGDTSDWWPESYDIEPFLGEHPLSDFLVRQCPLGDVLPGSPPVILAPPMMLWHQLRVNSPAPSEPLAWADDFGEVVVLRAWRIPTRPSRPLAYDLEGVELLLRPDAFELIEKGVMSALREQTVVVPSGWSDEFADAKRRRVEERLG